MSFKPAVGYGWDFHPRAIQLGIWDECYLLTTPKLIEKADITYKIDDKYKNAIVFLDYSIKKGKIVWQFGGQTVCSLKNEGRLAVKIKNAKFWYPRDTVMLICITVKCQYVTTVILKKNHFG